MAYHLSLIDLTQPTQPPSSSTIIKQPASIVNPPNHHHQATNLYHQSIQPPSSSHTTTQPPSMKSKYPFSPATINEIQKPIQPNHLKSQNPLIKQRLKKGSKPTYQDRCLPLCNKINASNLPLFSHGSFNKPTIYALQHCTPGASKPTMHNPC